ncbi:MAG: MCE family protein [Piscinibacter sp.]|nr:MCE family protein [Piscinibacter sp.]
MDNKFSYAVVGAFVLALGAVLIVGVLWLAAGGTGKKRYEPYEAIFKESVSGLNVNAPVKYLGVDVGKVREIQLDPRNPQQVHLMLQIERGTPVKRDTQAVLRTQGLTGIAYVELSGGSPDSPPLEAPPGGGLPMIPSKPSLATRIENVLTTVLGNIDRTAVSLNSTLDAENRAAFKALLADAADLVHALAAQRAAMSAAIAGAARTAENTARASAELAPLMARIAASADAIEKMAAEVQRAGATVDRAGAAVGRAADTAASGVRQINAETLPELQRLMAELDTLAASLRRLADQTERDPSSLILGPRNLAPGPGEKARP